MTTTPLGPPRSGEAPAVTPRATPSSFFGPLLRTFRMLVRDRFALVGMFVVATFALLAVIAPLIVPYDPFETLGAPDGGLLRLEEPSAEHWLGTTAFAKDVWSQLLVGSRVAFIVGIFAALAVGFLSTLLGLVSGYFGGYVDDAIMRMTDIALSIPTLPIAIVAVSILGPSLRNIILVISLLTWRNGARIVRSVVLTEKEKVFVQAARAAGASHKQIILRHILPNIFPVAFLWMTMAVAFAILNEASLSFLGLGDPTLVSWGQMLNVAFTSGAIRTAWWWVLPPSFCLVILVSSIYMIGRAYEEKTNPRLRRK